MSTSSNSSGEEVTIVKEGWLLKRGEYIKNFRGRYFVMKSDGSFHGFKEKPKSEEQYRALQNNFSIERAQVMRKSQPKQFTFIIRCFQLTTLVERTFAADSDADREEWIQQIEKVSKRLEEEKNSTQGERTAVADEKEAASAQLTLEDFQMLKVLGKGTFGKVMLGKEIKTGSVYAIKLLRKDVVLAKDEVEHTLTENRVLQSAKHPFLTELIYSFQTADRLGRYSFFLYCTCRRFYMCLMSVRDQWVTLSGL